MSTNFLEKKNIGKQTPKRERTFHREIWLRNMKVAQEEEGHSFLIQKKFHFNCKGRIQTFLYTTHVFLPHRLRFIEEEFLVLQMKLRMKHNEKECDRERSESFSHGWVITSFTPRQLYCTDAFQKIYICLYTYIPVQYIGI